MISENDIQAQNLAYYGNCRSSSQWRDFVLTLIGEMYQSAGSVDAGNFLRHVGSRVAAAKPLDEQPTLEAFEASLNGILQELEWGWVRLAVDNQSVRIVHGAYPGIMETADYWGQAMAAVLEGMYQQWFQVQGGGESLLQVQCIAVSKNGALVFRCGS